MKISWITWQGDWFLVYCLLFTWVRYCSSSLLGQAAGVDIRPMQKSCRCHVQPSLNNVCGLTRLHPSNYNVLHYIGLTITSILTITFSFDLQESGVLCNYSKTIMHAFVVLVLLLVLLILCSAKSTTLACLTLSDPRSPSDHRSE